MSKFRMPRRLSRFFPDKYMIRYYMMVGRKNLLSQLKKYSTVSMVLIVLIVVALITVGYLFPLHWMGFDGGYSTVTHQSTKHGITTIIVTQPAKSLWDWMQLLFIPAILAIGGLWFTRRQQENDKKTTDERAENDRNIAHDNQCEASLRIYLDNMSDLLFVRNLRTAKPNDEVRTVARARTLSTLRGLDGNRRGILIQFLYDTGLIDKSSGPEHISLSGADLSYAHLFSANLGEAVLNQVALLKANLEYANLSKATLHEALMDGANLNGADLREANLSGASLINSYLIDANLSGADLSKAHLGVLSAGKQIPAYFTVQKIKSSADAGDLYNGAHLRYANLSDANLQEADLEEAFLYNANLSRANLSKTKLRSAKMDHADLREANLYEANLSGASLIEANLERANLLDAIYTDEQLTQAKNLAGAILRDGTIHQ